jgi:hypothetical protein
VTTGNATGTLLGASLLTYRLLGPAVRSCTALLAAAPRVPYAGGQASSAFATASFRQQFVNFGVVRRPVDGGTGDQTTTPATPATPAVLAEGDGPPSDEPRRLKRASSMFSAAVLPGGGAEPTGPIEIEEEEAHAATVFGTAASWRVRSVGVLQMLPVKL